MAQKLRFLVRYQLKYSSKGSDLDRKGGESRRNDGTKRKGRGRDRVLHTENKCSVTEGNTVEGTKCRLWAVKGSG